MLTFGIDQASQAKVEQLLEIKFAPQVARSLSRAANSAKTAMAQAIATELGAKASDIKRYIFTKPATEDTLEARVYPQGKAGIPLIKLGATGPEPSRGKGGGVTVPGGGVYPHAFIAKTPSGHRGVFERKGTARLPIKELRTTPITDVFRRLRAVGMAKAEEALKADLVVDLKAALGKSA